MASTPPLMLAGASNATSWMPEVMPEPDKAFLERVRALYAHDPVLESALDRALETEAQADAAMDDKPMNASDMPKGYGAYGDLTPLFKGAGKLLAGEEGPRVAVFDVSGWDTHVERGRGRWPACAAFALARPRARCVQDGLGPGLGQDGHRHGDRIRHGTVKPNGNGGTDHGTAGAAFLLGGAVQGGTVRAEWVGLEASALQDGRDQPPRTDQRARIVQAPHSPTIWASHGATWKAQCSPIAAPSPQ